MSWISRVCERNIAELTGRYLKAGDKGSFLDFLIERMFWSELREPGQFAPENCESPAWWWQAADAYEAEIGSIDRADTIKEVVDSLHEVLKKHPEKTHLDFIKQYKIAQDLEI